MAYSLDVCRMHLLFFYSKGVESYSELPLNSHISVFDIEDSTLKPTDG